LNRTWQCGTIQLDFSMPERFDLEYTDKDGLKKRPIMLHRVIYGSLERFIGILLEHLNGRLPIWLSPIQVRVINFTDRNTKTCEKLAEKLKQQGIRTDEDLRSIPLPGKIKEAELMKIPYIIVIGDKEEQTKSVNVRKNGRTSVVKEDIFIKDILNEIKERN
jgi:threonyl-tRNA synthetase